MVGISKPPKRPSREKTLFALQLEKRLYIAALIEIKPDMHVEVPDVVVPMLKRFEDVVPPEVPKKMPPRRQTDHQIELVLGTRPPA